jgi:hypothetical protein
MLLLAGLALAASACCSTPPGPPDYSTPEATLLTYHEAFKNEDTEAEYECLSDELKRRYGNLGFSWYYDFRGILAEEYPFEIWAFSLQDLDDNIVDRFVSLDEGRAWLKLSVYGREMTIEFIREAVCIVENYEGAYLQLDPGEHPVRINEAQVLVEVPVDKYSARKTPRFFPRWRKVMVEKRWKFLDFSFLHEKMSGSAE